MLVDLESHTVSHHDLRHAPRGQDYTTWLHNEVYGCKETLESKLGVKIIAFAFPYGFHNEVVRKTAGKPVTRCSLQFTDGTWISTYRPIRLAGTPSIL
jgi:peptidoglycan/xylan/chitin deacetylase (PgdA/CDA1 family)